MELIRSAEEMNRWSLERRSRGLRVGFVPTMGFLHEGHLSLVEHAVRSADETVVSIFVNPKQFGPQEDLDQYPRDLDRDLDLLRPLGVDAVFLPRPEEIYPPGFQTRVEVTAVTRTLCGAFRPDFFPGVTTVVMKLFNIVRPHLAVFGEKDFQQLVTIKRMVRDMFMDVEVVGLPTVREADGLAMSSRNAYLTAEQRPAARALFEALELASNLAARGERNPALILEAVRSRLQAEPLIEIQYASLVDPETMAEIQNLDQPARLALAVFIGGTRLIDNALIAPPGGDSLSN